MSPSLRPSSISLSRSPLLLEISTYSFGFAAVTGALRRIPVLKEILIIPLIVSWFIGYSTWYIGSLLYDKDHPRKKDSWYGFAEFKQQHQTSALLGLIATVLCAVVPALLIPIAWLFTVSNLLWAIGAHHKKNMPTTDDPNYSSAKQNVFSYLTLTVTLLSFLTALEATALFFFPLSAPILIPVATAAEVFVTIIIFVLIGKFTLGTYEPDRTQIEIVQKTDVEPDKEQPNTAAPCPLDVLCFKSPLTPLKKGSAETCLTNHLSI